MREQLRARLGRIGTVLATCAVSMVGIHARALANGPRVRVHSTTCPGLDIGALQGRLNLELAAVSASADPALDLRLTVVCDPAALRLAVVDPRTGKRLERTIPAPAPEHPDRERVIALSVSELFATAWLELLVAPVARRPAPTPDAVDSTTEAAAPSKPKATSEPPPSPPRTDEVVVHTAVRFRHLGPTLPTGAVGLGYGGWIREHWGLFGVTEFEGGRARRDRGDVEALGARLGVGARWRSRRLGPPMRLWIGLRAVAAYTHLQGRPDAGQTGGTAQRFSADFGAAVGLRFALGRGVRLGLAVQGGYMTPGPVGRVAGEDPVRVDGGFVGVGVEVGITPRTRRARR